MENCETKSWDIQADFYLKKMAQKYRKKGCWADLLFAISQPTSADALKRDKFIFGWDAFC